MERLEQHRLSPPVEAMHAVAEAISILLATDPHMSVREALGHLDDLREVVDCLEGYQAFQRPLRSWRHQQATARVGVGGRESEMQVTV
jgi:hypothetical protein